MAGKKRNRAVTGAGKKSSADGLVGEELNEGDERVHTLYEWRRLRGMQDRLRGALSRLSAESKNGPIAFEHFLAKCRSMAHREGDK